MARPIVSLAPTGAQRMTQSACAHGAGQIVGDDVAKPQRLRALQDRNGRVGKNDAPGGVALARGAGDRRADQPYADNRQLFEDRLGEGRAEPFNHLCLA